MCDACDQSCPQLYINTASYFFIPRAFSQTHAALDWIAYISINCRLWTLNQVEGCINVFELCSANLPYKPAVKKPLTTLWVMFPFIVFFLFYLYKRVLIVHLLLMQPKKKTKIPQCLPTCLICVDLKKIAKVNFFYY